MHNWNSWFPFMTLTLFLFLNFLCNIVQGTFLRSLTWVFSHGMLVQLNTKTFNILLTEVVIHFDQFFIVMVLVHRALVQKLINILAIIAPRHPDRGQGIALV